GTGAIGVSGSAVGRWMGERLAPVLFALDGGRRRALRRLPGDPIDIAIDRTGAWHLLYREGLLATLSRDGRLLDVLDTEDGIPATARRLLADPETGELFVGSAQDGLAVVDPVRSGPGPISAAAKREKDPGASGWPGGAGRDRTPERPAAAGG